MYRLTLTYNFDKYTIVVLILKEKNGNLIQRAHLCLVTAVHKVTLVLYIRVSTLYVASINMFSSFKGECVCVCCAQLLSYIYIQLLKQFFLIYQHAF